MSDEQKHEPIEFQFSKVLGDRIKYVELDPDLAQSVQITINKVMEKQIYQAMAIPPELIVERGKTWKNSQTLRPSITLEFKHAQTDIIEQLQRVFETPYDRFKREFVTLLRDMGLHTDNVDKVRYVLDCSEGFDFLKTLSLTQMQDTEWLIQRLLDIYVDVTS